MVVVVVLDGVLVVVVVLDGVLVVVVVLDGAVVVVVAGAVVVVVVVLPVGAAVGVNVQMANAQSCGWVATATYTPGRPLSCHTLIGAPPSSRADGCRLPFHRHLDQKESVPGGIRAREQP